MVFRVSLVTNTRKSVRAHRLSKKKKPARSARKIRRVLEGLVRFQIITSKRNISTIRSHSPIITKKVVEDAVTLIQSGGQKKNGKLSGVTAGVVVVVDRL